MRFDSCDEDNFMILEDALSFQVGQSIELNGFPGDNSNLLGLNLPKFGKFPSKSLDDRLSFIFDDSCDHTVDMSIVTKEAYLEPVYPKYDDLDSLGGEWWDFNQTPQVKVVDRFLNDSLSVGSDFSERKIQIIESFVKCEEPKRIGCRCGMTKCLRLHCRCFRDLEYCAKNCKCTSCFNNEEHEEVRSFVINKTKDINKNAFTSKVVYMEHQEKGTINSSGCTCKTGCDRNYCECYKNKSGCSPLCRCSNCQNTLLSLPDGDIKRMIKGPSRKKNKIVIQDLENLAVKSKKDLSECAEIGTKRSNNCSYDSESDCGKHYEVAGSVMVAYHRYKRVKSCKRSQMQGIDPS